MGKPNLQRKSYIEIGIIMFNRVLAHSIRGMRTFGRSRDRPQTRIHNPMFPKGYLPNGVRFAVFCSLYLGTVGLTHFIHSGTNAKYSEIRNTEMYAVMKGDPIKEGYKNWEE